MPKYHVDRSSDEIIALYSENTNLYIWDNDALCTCVKNEIGENMLLYIDNIHN